MTKTAKSKQTTAEDIPEHWELTCIDEYMRHYDTGPERTIFGIKACEVIKHLDCFSVNKVWLCGGAALGWYTEKEEFGDYDIFMSPVENLPFFLERLYLFFGKNMVPVKIDALKAGCLTITSPSFDKMIDIIFRKGSEVLKTFDLTVCQIAWTSLNNGNPRFIATHAAIRDIHSKRCTYPPILDLPDDKTVEAARHYYGDELAEVPDEKIIRRADISRRRLHKYEKRGYKMEPDYIWRKEQGHVMGMDAKMDGYDASHVLSDFQKTVKKFNEDRQKRKAKEEAKKKEDVDIARVRKAVQEKAKETPVVGCIDRPANPPPADAPDIVLSASEIREAVLAEEIAALSKRVNQLLAFVRK